MITGFEQSAAAEDVVVAVAVTVAVAVAAAAAVVAVMAAVSAVSVAVSAVAVAVAAAVVGGRGKLETRRSPKQTPQYCADTQLRERRGAPC